MAAATTLPRPAALRLIPRDPLTVCRQADPRRARRRRPPPLRRSVRLDPQLPARHIGPACADRRLGSGAFGWVPGNRCLGARARRPRTECCGRVLGATDASRKARISVDLPRPVAAVKCRREAHVRGRSAPTTAFSCSCYAPSCTSPVISWPGFRRESGFGPADGGWVLIGARRRATRSAHPPLQRRWLHDELRVRQPGSRAVRARNRRDSPRRPSVRSAECARR
jgi:hypothetical protein